MILVECDHANLAVRSRIHALIRLRGKAAVSAVEVRVHLALPIMQWSRAGREDIVVLALASKRHQGWCWQWFSLRLNRWER